MASHTKPVDRAVPSTYRYQYYNDLTHATEVTVDVNSDLGRPAKTGFIINNNDAGGIVLYFNYDKDIDGSMQGIPMTAADKFSFSVYEMNVTSIKITGTDVDVDIFVS